MSSGMLNPHDDQRRWLMLYSSLSVPVHCFARPTVELGDMAKNVIMIKNFILIDIGNYCI